MKKWMFVIFPGILFVIFLLVYNQRMDEINTRERLRREAVEKQKAEDEARKKASEEKAREDMKRHTEEQAAEDLAREKEAAARYQQNMDRIRAETAQANQQIADTNKLLSDLQHELDTLRSQRESESNHEFDLTKQLEVARIAQRNAELETQRMVDMIAARADRSSLTAMPPPPPPSKE